MTSKLAWGTYVIDLPLEQAETLYRKGRGELAEIKWHDESIAETRQNYGYVFRISGQQRDWTLGLSDEKRGNARVTLTYVIECGGGIFGTGVTFSQEIDPVVSAIRLSGNPAACFSKKDYRSTPRYEEFLKEFLRNSKEY